MDPKVSLVIPCCNVERYVEQCVRSAMGQTLSDIEIICVNDGSTDGTLAVLERLAAEDKRIRIIDKPNTGYGNSMNVGFDAARGEYLGILESDDFIEPDMLETHYSLAKEHDAEVVKSNFYFYWSVPEERDEHCRLLDPQECGRILCPYDEPHVFFIKPSIWSAIYRADFIRGNGIRFNETPGASYQDASFNFQVWLNAQRVWFIYDAYLHYRQDNEKSSVNSPGKVYCVCDEYERMEGFVKALDDPVKRAFMMAVLVKMKFDSYMWNYDRLAPELGGEFFFRFSEEMKRHIENGEIAWEIFEPEKERELRMLVDDPRFSHVYRTAFNEGLGTKQRLLRYFKEGGIDYVLKPRRY
ncbi:MAG: glycosyltransferase [Eggerthellaceae bacterium]|nr:glycosyltransferase [Eggerthellaceae bacterium]